MGTGQIEADRRGARFSDFFVDFRAREVRKHGVKIKVPGASFEVLRALLERPGGVVTREELRERLWPDGTFVDYDNSLNSTVNRLRDALHDSAEKPRYIETLPRLGYRFIAPVEEILRGSPVAPNGANRESAAEVASASFPRPASWLGSYRVRIAAGLLLSATLVIGAFSATRFLRNPASAVRPDATLAVLPFRVSAGDPNRALGLVMAQDLISQLSRTPGIRVLPATVVFRFLNWEGQPAEIGMTLNATILTGSVTHDGNRILVQAQLLSKAGGPPLLTRSVSAAADELYAANDSLVVDVRKTLLGQPKVADMLPPVARPTAVILAYQNYAEGLFQIEQRSAVGISRAIDAFELATRKDPQFAAAHAGLAMAYAFDRQKWQDAERIARHALELDPRSSQARAVLGFIHLFWLRNWERARDEFKSAIDLDPSNATAHQWYALYFAARSFFHEAKTEIELANALDPYSPAIWADKGDVLILAHRFGEAIAACNQALTLSPDFLNAHICLYRAYRQNGMASHAAAKLSDIRQRMDRQLVVYPGAYAEAEELALQGRVDEAVQKLHSAQMHSEPSVIFALANPVFRNLHSHPGYRALLKKLSLDAGFVPYTARPD